jgi:hypothetical protein
MRMLVRAFAVTAFLALGGGVLLDLSARAAPKPVPEPSADERDLRALAQPLRDGVTDGAELQPLLDWIAARAAAGADRDSERSLRRVLKRIDQDLQTDLLHAAEWVQTLSHQRAVLYRELSADQVSLRRAIEKYHEFPPVPSEEELLPTRAELSDWIPLATGTPAGRESASTDAGDAAMEGADAEDAPEPAASDLDASRLLNQLTADLTSLRHLLHACDNEYEEEKKRQRRALALLTELFKSPQVLRGKKPAETK